MNNLNLQEKISVLMTAYNAEKYIASSIESILNQTYKEFELLIIDDGSIDNTWNIIKSYADCDKRVRPFKNKINVGISINRNRLINLAQCKYILWQDADDISMNTRLFDQYNFMEKNPEVGICGGYLEFFNSKGTISIREYSTNDQDLRKNVLKYSPVSQGASIIRKEIILRIGSFREELLQAEDLDFSLRIGSISKFANLPKIVLKYRIHDDSATVSKLKENIYYTLKVRYNAVKKYGYSPSIFDYCTNFLTLIILIFPSTFIYKIFNLMRNKKTS